MNDKELLEKAAKAAGIEKDEWTGLYRVPPLPDGTLIAKTGGWNPLTDDGDALRLAVKLNLIIEFYKTYVYVYYAMSEKTFEEDHDGDQYAATRRAIVRAAAQIGKNQND